MDYFQIDFAYLSICDLFREVTKARTFGRTRPMVRRTAASIGHALRGLRAVWREEANFRIHCVVAVLVLGGAVMFGFSFTEISVLFIAVLFVLGSEILNTVVEDACDALHPEHHRVVGKIKDMMAGLVLLNAIGAVVIGVITLTHHFLA